MFYDKKRVTFSGETDKLYENNCHFCKNLEKGSVIVFTDISYKVRERQFCSVLRKSKEKVIIDGISGIFRPGMNAIMGPTGCGKTSLLDILAGRKNPKFRKGRIFIDGREQPPNFSHIVGYVQQDSLLYQVLTVRENLLFAANLRLTNDCSSSRKVFLVDQIIKQFNLLDCADTIIGTDMLRGISGGEKKRTSIGMALINSPPVLFLDEPTSGLDANTALSVMSLLYQLAAEQRTIVFSIHQPRYSIFKLINYVIVMEKGRMAYQGEANQVLEYFSSYGFQCETKNNPADFILDVINMDVPLPASGSIDFDNTYRNSSMWTRVQADIYSSMEKYETTEPCEHRLKPKFYASFFIQFSALSQRSFLNMRRNPLDVLMETLFTIVVSLIIGATYFQLDSDRKTGIFNRAGVFYFLSTNLMFGNMAALDLFIRDRRIFIEESMSGYYRTFPYLFSKIILEILLRRLIPILFLGFITYWMIGFESNAIKFGIYLLNMFVTSIACAGIVLALSISISSILICTIINNLIFVVMNMYNGGLVNLTSIGRWLSWIKYINVVKYNLAIFLITELKDKQFCDYSNETRICDSGNEYLKTQGIAYETDWNLWENFVMMLLMYFLLMLLTYVQLRMINKYK